jgi:hypothetical protein
MPTWFEDHQRGKDEDAARRGATEAKNETFLGSMIHEVADITRGIIPIPKDSEERAKEHAYHTTPKGWERESNDSTANPEAEGSYSLSSSDDHQSGSALASPRLVKQEKREAFLLWFIPALVTLFFCDQSLSSSQSLLYAVIWPLPWLLGGIAWVLAWLVGSQEQFWMIDLFYKASAGLIAAIIVGRVLRYVL